MIGMGSVSTHILLSLWLLVMFWNRFVRLANVFFVFISLLLTHFFHQLLPPDPRLTPISHSWWQEKHTLTGHCQPRFFWHPRHWHLSRTQCQNPWFGRELSSCFGSHKHPWWSFLRHKAWSLWSLQCRYSFSRTTSNSLHAWHQNSHSCSFTHLDCSCKLSWTGRTIWARTYNRTFIARKCWRDECGFCFGVCHGKDVRGSRVSADHVVANALNSLTFEASIFLVTLASVVLFTGNFCTCSVRFTLSFFLVLCLLPCPCVAFPFGCSFSFPHWMGFLLLVMRWCPIDLGLCQSLLVFACTEVETGTVLPRCQFSNTNCNRSQNVFDLRGEACIQITYAFSLCLMFLCFPMSFSCPPLTGVAMPGCSFPSRLNAAQEPRVPVLKPSAALSTLVETMSICQPMIRMLHLVWTCGWLRWVEELLSASVSAPRFW